MTTADQTDMAHRPALTALMPVKAYRERYLHQAVRSLLGQTDPAWRLLVIVEESDRADLESVLAEHLADSRIRMIANEGRKLAGAFNTGMRRAETGFVAILLGDDLWAPHAVEVLTTRIRTEPDTDFFHSSRRIIDETGKPVSSVHRSRPSLSLDDFGGSSPVKHLLCWNRNKGLAIGGMDETLNSVGVDDFDFPWSMAEHGMRFTGIPDCLYIYRDHREFYRLTTHLPLSHHKREIARILRKHGCDRETVRAAVAKAERSYLRQCLYRSHFDQMAKRLRGQDARSGWRERYR